MMAPSSGHARKDTARGGAQKYRVLLLSGNEMVRFSVENYFQDTDIAVTSAEDPQDGLKKLRKTQFDAVITEIGGVEDQALQFRQDVRKLNGRIPILFITPFYYWSEIKLLNRVMEDPQSYYIPENADRKFLLGKLHQVLHASESETALEQLRAKIEKNEFLAGELQLAMLPPWVHFCDCYEFSSLYRPFSGVSGDLFEWIPLDDHRTLFIFGDVSGHGTHSALAMTAVQSFLKQIILLDMEKAKHPSLIASEIHDFFCNNLQNIVYMSTLIAYFDFKKNYLCYQNAGYMDITCVNAETGEIENINPENRGSLPLGMIKGTVYTEESSVEYHFTDASVFLFHSDGLIDLAKDENGEIPLDTEMCRKLSRVLVMDSQKEDKSVAIPFRAYHTLEQFGYTWPQDDLSMVLVRKPMHRENECVFACRVPADKKAADEICERASAFVTGWCHDEELSVDTELLLEEYLINVIMHGLNEYEKLNEYIAVRLCAGPDELKLMVWDHGREWDGLMMPATAAEEKLDRLNEQMSASGRGLPIISRIATHIGRQRFSGLNETVFHIPLRRNGAGEKSGSAEK
ncbi:MAG: SpoIIE family protein phosphatase [Lentisphaeria bacterium]|nr:SpoIIE family protein phosphatase [Lentisphaeria bacterium]